MKLSISAKQTQSLILSPQLQQSLALLQAPLCELHTVMESFINDNPCVEMLDNNQSEEEISYANDKAELPADMQWTSLSNTIPSYVEEFPLENNPGRAETLEEYLTRELVIAGLETGIIHRLDEKGFFPFDPDTLTPQER